MKVAHGSDGDIPSCSEVVATILGGSHLFALRPVTPVHSVLRGTLAGPLSRRATHNFRQSWRPLQKSATWPPTLQGQPFPVFLFFFFAKGEEKSQSTRKVSQRMSHQNQQPSRKTCVTRVPDHFSSRGRWTVTTLRGYGLPGEESTSAGASQNHAPRSVGGS